MGRGRAHLGHEDERLSNVRLASTAARGAPRGGLEAYWERSPRSPRSSRRRDAAAIVLALSSIALWVMSLSEFNPYSATTAGLIGLLPVAWWLALASCVVAVGLALAPLEPTVPVVLVALSSFLLVLHGTLPLSEATPRFASAYTIAGFTQYVGATGHTIPLLDARMLWPGLFAGAGLTAQAMHVNARWFLTLAPLVFNALYLLPIKALSNRVLSTPRARWAALPLFLAGNWIDQDYFSPQAVNLLLYLCVIVIVMNHFGRGRAPQLLTRCWRAPLVARGRSLVRRLARVSQAGWSGRVPVGDDYARAPARERRMLAGCVALVCAASVMSHQFTPAALTLALLGLVIAGRSELRHTWFLVGLGVMVWLSWVGEPFWVGHMKQVFGGVAQLGASVSGNVTNRLNGASRARHYVQYARAGASLLTWAAALFSLVYAWRRGRSVRALGVLLIMPSFVALAVTYGGEVALRVLLFSLPIAAVLIAGVLDFVPLKGLGILVPVATGIALVAMFPVTRYGNEEFEAVTPGELRAAVFVSHHVAANGVVVVANTNSPLRAFSTGRYQVSTGGGVLNSSGEKEMESGLKALPAGAWFYLSRAQAKFNQIYLGYPSNWLAKEEALLMESGRVRVKFRDSTATVLRLAPMRRGTAASVAGGR